MSSRDFAVLDLGSNSFHLLVTRLEDSGQLLIIDRLKARVRLAAGLDAQKVISGPYQKKAITTLSEFGERLSGIPTSNIQVVATDTFRKAKNGSVLLKEATKAVGVPIEIISGLEEARLIFTGVIHDYPSTDRRMIIDIGGGSLASVSRVWSLIETYGKVLVPTPRVFIVKSFKLIELCVLDQAIF